MYINYMIVMVFGMVVGSFLNVCIHRIPRNMSIAYPASHCPKCNNSLSFKDLLPVISFLVYRGKCRQCKERISTRYILVELICGLGSIVLLHKYGLALEFYAKIVLFYGLVLCSFIDFEFKIVPDKIVVFLLLYGITINTITSKEAIVSGLLGLAVGGLSLLILALIYEDGLGGGDVKLVAAIGLYVGWSHILIIIWLAAILAILMFAISYLIKKVSFKQTIPFVPYLSMAAFIDMLMGQELINLIIYGVNKV